MATYTTPTAPPAACVPPPCALCCEPAMPQHWLCEACDAAAREEMAAAEGEPDNDLPF
jgi:hypothetical protein